MRYEVKRLDYAELDALVRRAQEQRMRLLGQWIARGAHALGRLAKTLAAALGAAYEAERGRSGARAATGRWASRY